MTNSVKNTFCWIVILLFSTSSLAQTSDWLPLDQGLFCDSFPTTSVYDLYVDTVENEIYATGTMHHDGNCNPLEGLGKWDGESWEMLGEVDNSTSYSSVIYNGDLIASGPFLFVDIIGYPNNTNIWTGTEWDTIPGGPFGNIMEFYEWDDVLYAVGDISYQGDAVTGLAVYYDGESWASLSEHSTDSDITLCIERFQDNFFVGGGAVFTNGLGEDIYKIFFFDGEYYRPVGQGLQEYPGSWVGDLAVFNDKLYLSGNLKLPGSDNLYSILTFDGDSLRPIENQPNYSVRNMRVHEGALYIAGGFTQVGDVEAEHVARFDGESWLAVNTDSMFSKTGFYQGLGHPTVIRDFEIMQDTLYLSGEFYRMSQDTVRGVAKLNKNLITDFPPIPNSVSEEVRSPIRFELYPNPSSGNLSFAWSQAKAGNVEWKITDLKGRVVLSKKSKHFKLGKHEEQMNLEHLPPGTYLVKVTTTEGTATERWVKVE
ncbi:T9SS type A sorting domain-containing protein [Halocola ammonii]